MYTETKKESIRFI